MEHKKKFNQHPYRRNNNYYQQERNDNYRTTNKKYEIFNQKASKLNIYPHSMYDLPFPKFQQPFEIGIIISENRKLEIEKRKLVEKNKSDELEKAKGLKYLILPENCENLNYDLNLGISKFVEHIPHQHGLDSLLKWIVENKEKLLLDKQMQNSQATSKSNERLLKPDFICWRGLLTTLLATPYDKQKDWQFSVIKYKGNLYLCEIETEKNKMERENKNEQQKAFTYWGHKFESYITTDLISDGLPNGADDIPDQENNFGTCVVSKLNEHSLFYAAEIDCCFKEEHKSLDDYCEIKTHKGKSIDDLMFGKNMKFLKWWLQSYLVDIRLIKVGLRDDSGIVSRIIDCKTSDIYKASSSFKRWKENLCFNFLSSVLDLLKLFCVEENAIYKVTRAFGGESIFIDKIEEASEEFSQHYFLRDWFKSAF